MPDIATLGLRVDASGAIVSTRQLKGELTELGVTGQRTQADMARLVARFASFTAVSATLVQAARDARLFSDAMAEVSTLLSDTSGIDGLTDSVRALGAAFGKAPVEEAKALYQIISAGASTAAVAVDVLTASNKLAIGGVTDVATAADGLTTIMNAYGPAVGSATEVSDRLFVAMRAGKTTIDELASGIGKVAPIAASSGVALEDLLAATAALTKGGISTKESFTGIRAILATILKPTSEAATQAAALGIEFNATALKAKGLNQFLVDLTNAVGDNKDAMAQLFGGIEALVPAIALSGNAAADYAAVLRDMGAAAGETETAFNKIADSPGFKLDKLLQTVKNEALGVGLALLNVLSPAVVAATNNIGALTQGLGLLAGIFASRFLLRATADITAYVTKLAAQRAATIATAEATVAAANAEVVAGAKRLSIAQTQLRALQALGVQNEALRVAQARVNIETAIATQTTASLAAAQTAAATATSRLAGALGVAAGAARTFWAAIGGGIGATFIALFAFYELFIKTGDATEAQTKRMEDARRKADEYAKTLGDLSVEALKAAEAQERLNLATLAAKLSETGGRVVALKREAVSQSDENGGAAVVLAQQAAAAQAEYNKQLAEAEAANERLARVTAQRGVVEKRIAEDAAASAAAAAEAAKNASAKATEQAQALSLQLARQRELNAAFGSSKAVLDDINAKYNLRAKLLEIASQYTGAEAAQLRALVVEIDRAEAAARKLATAKDEEEAGAKRLAEARREDERRAKAQAADDARLAEALKQKADARARGEATAKRANELLDREIQLLKATAKEAIALGDAWLFADKQAEFIAAGLDAVNAAIAAQAYVAKTQEIRDLTAATVDWGSALEGVNGSLTLLVQSLDGGAKAAAQAVGALTGALELLVRAQERAKKASDAGIKVSGRDAAVAGGGAALGGFAAGSAFGSQTSSRTAGTLGGAVSGAAAGALAGSALGPGGALAGAAIGALTGALGGFISASKNATQEAIAAASAQKALRSALAGLRASLGNDTLGAAIAQARQQFEQLRLETEKAFSGKKNETERNRILAELNVLEAKRIEQLREEAAEQQRRTQADLKVRELRANGSVAEANALAFAEAQAREYADAVKAGADAATLAAIQATQLAEANQRAAQQQEETRRTLFDLTNATRAFTDPIGAARESDIEEANRRVWDAIERGASEAELAALNLYNAAVLARREAERVENDTRQREALVVRGLSLVGDTRGAERASLGSAQRQEMADAIRDGMSETNMAILQFVQFAEREAMNTRFAIEDGTRAIQEASADDLAAVNVLIDVTRETSARQIAAINKQIASIERSTASQQKAYDEQIAAIREDAKLRAEAVDREIAFAREASTVAKEQLSVARSQLDQTKAVVDALDKFAQSLTVGEFSPFSLEDQLAEARGRFDALATAAQGGDAQAALALPEAANALLTLSRQYNASNAGFVEDFNRVAGVLESVRALFGAQLPVAERQLAAAEQQVASLERTLDALGKQKDEITRTSQREIEAIQKLKDEAKENATRLIDSLKSERETISRDAEETIAKLEETRAEIEEGIRLAIETLIANENAALQTRLKENEFYDTFKAYSNSATAYYEAATNALDTQGNPSTTPGSAPGAPPTVSTAPNFTQQMDAQVAELRSINRSLSERLDATIERLDRLSQVNAAGTNTLVTVGSRNVEATYIVAAEVRAASQAELARARPVGVVSKY